MNRKTYESQNSLLFMCFKTRAVLYSLICLILFLILFTNLTNYGKLVNFYFIFKLDKIIINILSRAVKFTLLYLLCLTLLLILFTNSPKPGKLIYLPVKIKTKIY